MPLSGQDGLSATSQGCTKQIPSQLAYEAYACAQCGYCIDVCDQYYGRQWESETARGRWYFLRQYLEGKAQFNQMMLDSFLLCTTCQRCNQVCQVQIPIQQMWDKMRGLVIQEKGYHTFPGFEMMGSSFTTPVQYLGRGARSERDKWVPRRRQTAGQGLRSAIGRAAPHPTWKMTSRKMPCTSSRKAAVEFTYLGKDEGLLRHPDVLRRQMGPFRRSGQGTISPSLISAASKTLVISCPGCWVTLNHYYREWAPKLGLTYNIKSEAHHRGHRRADEGR